MAKHSEVITCGDKLYYDINPNSKMDVPSSFYVRLESEWDEWSQGKKEVDFYNFCLNKVNKSKKV